MTATEVKTMIDEFAVFLPAIREMAPAEFETELTRRLDRIDEVSRACPEDRPALMQYCFEVCAEEIDRGEALRHSRHKPFGYAGDFMIIDWIYQSRVNQAGDSILWDSFYHRQPAVQSVRHRKTLFHKVCEETRAVADGAFRGISIASGPCRDVCEVLTRAGSNGDGMRFHCVDLDERAVVYARSLLESHGVADRVEFEVKNALLLRPGRNYHLTWSGGLFDYLNDRQAVSLLRRMWMMTCGGGGRLSLAILILITPLGYGWSGWAHGF